MRKVAHSPFWTVKAAPIEVHCSAMATAPAFHPADPADEEIARVICDTRELAGRRYHEGEYVAVLRGQVVAVGRSFDQVRGALSEIESDPLRGLIFRVEDTVEDVIR